MKLNPIQIALLLANFVLADRNASKAGAAQPSELSNIITTLLDLFSEPNAGFVAPTSAQNIATDIERALGVAQPYMSGGGVATVQDILTKFGASETTVKNILAGQPGEIAAIGGSYNGKPDTLDVFGQLRSFDNSVTEALGYFDPKPLPPDTAATAS